MAELGGMTVLCSLYRANRLASLVRSVPNVIQALGSRLDNIVLEFWSVKPQVDMQFRTEAEAFCDFLRPRFSNDHSVLEALATAEAQLAQDFG